MCKKNPDHNQGVYKNGQCRLCQIEYGKARSRAISSVPELAKRRREYQRKLSKLAKHRNKHREYEREYCKTQKYKDRRAAYQKKRCLTNPNYLLRRRLGIRLYRALKGQNKSASTIKLLGCPIEFAVSHIQKQFTEGMSLENHGQWHVDHILPLSSFDLSDPDQQRKACHYTNLQPLWKLDNLRKGCKL